MDLANLSDEEVRAVMVLTRLRHERQRYAQVVVEAEQSLEPLSEVDAGIARGRLAEELTEAAKAIEAARTLAAQQKAEAERMAAAQAEAKGRKVGN